MEVSSEISQKIRSAIKAKLLELGAYVDDELPDYIMVMVANKRSRVQMKSDLGLFLGVNTDPFTWWLHNLLTKLQTIKSHSDKQGSAEVVSGVTGPKKVGKLQKVAGGNKVVKRKVSRVGVDASLLKVTAGEKKLEGTEETQIVNSGTESGEIVKIDACLSKQVGGNDTSLQNCNKVVRQFSSPQEPGNGLVVADNVSQATTEVVNSRTVSAVNMGKTAALFTNVDITASSVVSESSTAKKFSNRPFKPSAVVRKRRASTSILDHVIREAGEIYDSCNHAVNAGTTFTTATARKVAASTSSPQANRQRDNEDSQIDVQGDHEQPPQKLLKVSEAVRIEDIKQALAEVIEKTQSCSDDIANFSRMLESSLRKLRPQDFPLAKLRIQQILFEFETIATQENNVEAMQDRNIFEHECYPNQNPKCNSISTYFHTMEAASDLENSTSLSVSAPADRRKTFSSPHTPPGTPPSHDTNQNSDDQAEHSAASDHPTDNHIAGKYDCATSEQRTHFESDSQVDRIIFHPKSALESLNSSRKCDKYNSVHSDSKAHNRLMVKSREKERSSGKLQQRDRLLQSPLSLTKTDRESPSSAHSSPHSNSLGLAIRRQVTSASRESTLSPHDLPPKPGSSHVHKSKPSSAKSKPPPPILVDSIHNRKRPESVESSSVLRQNWQRDKSPRAVDSAKSDAPESPKHYGPEALKVMAKNLKITVINKRAVKSHEESSSDDSDEDDDEDVDSSDNEDDEGQEEKEKMEDKEAQNKAISGQPSS